MSGRQCVLVLAESGLLLSSYDLLKGLESVNAAVQLRFFVIWVFASWKRQVQTSYGLSAFAA
jgi:hypothetical protein